MEPSPRRETQHQIGPHAARDDRGRRRRPGWGNAAIMRTAALVIGMYIVVQLVWFAHFLFLVGFLGVLFGLAVSVGVDRLERMHVRRGLGAAIIVITFFGVLVGFGALMAPTLHDQSIELRRRLPDAIDRVEIWMNSHRSGFLGVVINSVAGEASADTVSQPGVTPTPGVPPTTQTDSISLNATLRHRVGAGVSDVTKFLFPFLSSTLAVVSGFIIIVFLAIYIGADPEMYRRGIMHLFPHGKRERAGEVLSAIASVLRKWLVTQLIAMLTIGVISTIVLLALGIEAAFALGLIAGLLEFVPTIGPILSAIPAIAMGFISSPEKALWVAIAYWGIQFFENHLLIPLLMKGGIDLPPALTIFSQALMALIFGFLGLMCAVPILAATMVAVKMLYVEGVVGDPQIGPGEDPAKGIE
jgi:predicted PurR-regulated permease PerM